MKLTPEEAYNALTINGAFAMGIESTHGCIFKGYKGKLIVTNPASSLAFFPYAFATNHIYNLIN
jgi:imidazolonepropionase